MLFRSLQNETYTGVLSSSAYKSGPLGSGKRVFVPEDERVRVENAHPAIIDKDTFREVQERMKKKRKGEAQQFLLKGLVRYGECGRLMVREKNRFRCRYQKFTEHREVESIPEAELEEIVWKAVDIQLRLLEEKEEVFQREKELCEEKRKKLLPEIKKKRMQVEKKREEIKQLYHQYRQGKMGKAEYLARKRWEGNLVEEMETELAKLEAEEEKQRKRMEEIKEGSVSIAEWLRDREDKRKLLQNLIKNIDVYENNRINITWRFQNKVEI